MLQFIAFALLWAFLWWVFTLMAGFIYMVIPALATIGVFIWFAYTALAGYLSYKTIY